MQQIPPPQRRRTVIPPKRNWIQRNPKLFQVVFITGCLLTLFSKPIYDGLIVDSPQPRHK